MMRYCHRLRALAAVWWGRQVGPPNSQSCCLIRSFCVSPCCHDRPPAGRGRILTDPSKVFEFNNWDNVVWDVEQEEAARKTAEDQALDLVPDDKQLELEMKADGYWDEFYQQHNNRFFKDRHWLFTEFPELATEGATGTSLCSDETAESDGSLVKDNECDVSKASVSIDQSEHCSLSHRKGDDLNLERNSPGDNPVCVSSFPGEKATFRILEVGCGVGNTVFPVLRTNNDAGLMVYCCDFSTTAIQLVKEHPDYNSDRCHAFVCDVADDRSEVPFPQESLDIIVLIFVLSAVHPQKMQAVVDRLSGYLKPGGQILFRDYGRYDMAQLRFKKGKCLQENFYVRGDGTRVYFFTQEELRDMFTKAGLEENQNFIDRRLQVNRGRQLKMYRVWIQCKYRKPIPKHCDK